MIRGACALRECGTRTDGVAGRRGGGGECVQARARAARAGVPLGPLPLAQM